MGSEWKKIEGFVVVDKMARVTNLHVLAWKEVCAP
jgi:hypothetical protein